MGQRQRDDYFPFDRAVELSPLSHPDHLRFPQKLFLRTWWDIESIRSQDILGVPWHILINAPNEYQQHLVRGIDDVMVVVMDVQRGAGCAIDI